MLHHKKWVHEKLKNPITFFGLNESFYVGKSRDEISIKISSIHIGCNFKKTKIHETKLRV